MDVAKWARQCAMSAVFALGFHCSLRSAAVLCTAAISAPAAIAQQASQESPTSKNAAILAHVLASVPEMLGVLDGTQIRLDGSNNLKVGQASISVSEMHWLQHDRAFDLADVDWAFPAAKALVYALLDQNRQLDGRPLRTVGLLNECEAVLGASAVVTGIAVAGRPSIDSDFLNQVNTRIARSLNNAGPVKLPSANSREEPLPVTVAGPTEVESAEELVYPWFELPVTFLALSSGSGFRLAKANQNSTNVRRATVHSAVVDYQEPESFSDWAERLCARYMFIDEDDTNYVRVKERSIRESVKGPSKIAAVDFDILNSGNKRLLGSLLVAVLGESTNTEDFLDIQFARILDFDLPPKGKKRFVERIEYKIQKARGIRLLLGPELDGPTTAASVGQEIPIGTCAEKQLSSLDAFRSGVSKYAVDAPNNFKNSKTEKVGEVTVGYLGRYPIPNATDVAIFGTRSKKGAMVSAQLLHVPSEEQALKRFWATVKKLKQMCGEKAGEIRKRESGDDRERISFEIEQFGPRASLSLAVREVQASTNGDPPGYSVSITIARHFRIFP